MHLSRCRHIGRRQDPGDEVVSVSAMAEVPNSRSVPFLLVINPPGEDLHCIICFLASKEPVLTRCDHRFCGQCLEEYILDFLYWGLYWFRFLFLMAWQLKQIISRGETRWSELAVFVGQERVKKNNTKISRYEVCTLKWLFWCRHFYRFIELTTKFLSSPLPRFRGSFRYQSRAPCCTGEVFRSFSVTRKNMIFEKMPSSSLLLLDSQTQQSAYKAIAFHLRVYPYLSHQTLTGKTQASLR